MSLGTKNRILCLVLTLSLLLTLIGCGRVDQLLSSTHKDALIINEVVTSNQLSLQDEVYGSPDWIELYNGSDQSISLNSYYITDNVEAPQKAFRLPKVDLAPGAFYLLFASKKGGPNNLGFSLKRGGETLTLLDAHMEEISSLIVPALIRDVSYARRPDGSYGYCDLPTPGAINSGTILDALPLTSQLVKEPEPEEVVEEPARSPDILITEVVSKNKASLSVDGCDGCTEWVELFNPNDMPIALTGFTLTDDMAEVDKHNFPEMKLGPCAHRHRPVRPGGGPVPVRQQRECPGSGGLPGPRHGRFLGQTVRRHMGLLHGAYSGLWRQGSGYFGDPDQRSPAAHAHGGPLPYRVHP